MLGLMEHVIFCVDGCGNAETLNLARLPSGTLILQSRGVKSDGDEFLVLDRVYGMSNAGADE